MGNTRAGAHVVIPNKLYQRGQFLTWPRSQKERFVEELGITCIVDLWGKIDADMAWEKPNRIYLQWHIEPRQVPPNADLMVNTIASLMHAGHVVLIHCEAGRYRSGWLTARVYAAYMGVDGPTALAAVEEAAKIDLGGPLLADILGYA